MWSVLDSISAEARRLDRTRASIRLVDSIRTGGPRAGEPQQYLGMSFRKDRRFFRMSTMAVLTLLVVGVGSTSSGAESFAGSTIRAVKTVPAAIVRRSTTVLTKPATSRPANSRPVTSKQGATTRPVVTTKPLVLFPAPGGGERYEFTSRTELFEDLSRGTARTSASAATATRKLPTLVITPKANGKKFPLFVFGHGLGGEPVLYQPLLEAIAARGYVVAAPTFPLSSRKSPGGPSLFDEPNQPADMSFVITKLLTDATVDPELVVVGGHSLGAITTIDLVANSCCFDKRVDAAVMVAGTANVFTSGALFDSPAVPSLFVHGDKDATVSYALGYSTWKAVLAPKWFLTVNGGDHSFGILGQPTLVAQTGALMVDAMVRFTDSRVKGANGGDSTKALQVAVTANPSLFRLESVAK
jgi:poly(3-hydroxybutyrate) depolymerase